MNTIISHNASHPRNLRNNLLQSFPGLSLERAVSHIIVLICQCMLLIPLLSNGDISNLFSFIGTAIELNKLQWY